MTDLLHRVFIRKRKQNGRNSERSSGRFVYTISLAPIMHFAYAVIANNFANKVANIMGIVRFHGMKIVPLFAVVR